MIQRLKLRSYEATTEATRAEYASDPSDNRHPIPKKPYTAKASKAKKEMDDLRKHQCDEHSAANKEKYRNTGGDGWDLLLGLTSKRFPW